MQNARLDESQTGIKTAGRNINNLIYADDTTLMGESEEELKSLLMRVKEEGEEAGLKLSIQKTKIMASSLIRWPKYWSFSFSLSPSSEYSELISFRIDWFDLPAVQGTLKSLFQYHNLKVSILQPSAFFMVQLSHLYMTPGETIALTLCQQTDISAF